MQEKLIKNFYEIQKKIDEILNLKELHIKQISDLERYVLMQKEVVKSYQLLRGN